MPLTSTYMTGTITVAAKGTVVTGAGTNWLAGGVRPGDILAAQGLTVTIAAVTNANTLFLATTWPGDALAGARYEVRYTPDATRVLASSREAIAAIESARSDIYISANIYASPAAGLAATTPGQQFQTISVNGENVVRYRHDAGGVATEVARYPTASAVNAAVTQATTAAVTAADAVRAQVKTDADLAAAAANGIAADRAAFQQSATDNLWNVPHVVEQVDGTIPPRPSGYRWCYWHCWDNPKANMSVRDVWIKLDPPTLPSGITRSNFKLIDQLNGTLRVDVTGIPDDNPPLLGLAYRFDAETAWTPAGISGNGSFITRALPPGAHTLEIAAQNFLGYSTANQIYSFSLLTDGTIPTQSFAGYSGPLTNLDHWLASSTPFTVSGGKARNAERNTTYWNYLDLPVGTRFFVEAAFAMIADSTRVDLRIGAERLHLLVKPSGSWVVRDAAGTSLLSGTAATPVTSARIEITPTTARALVNGSPVGEVGHAVALTGVRAGIGWRNAVQDATWSAIQNATYFTSVRAGKLP